MMSSGTRISRCSLINCNVSSRVKGKFSSASTEHHDLTWPPLFDTRYLWVSNDMIMSQQKGVFRMNCIDCLDRTNVVEVSFPLFYSSVSMLIAKCGVTLKSAFARHILNRQLGSVALQYPSGASKVESDVVFNDGMSVDF